MIGVCYYITYGQYGQRVLAAQEEIISRTQILNLGEQFLQPDKVVSGVPEYNFVCLFVVFFFYKLCLGILKKKQKTKPSG